MRYSVYKYIKNLSDSLVEAMEHIKSDNKNIGLLADCIVAVSAIKDNFTINKVDVTLELDLFLENLIFLNTL